MKPVVYTGTSISHSDARKILDADYRAPVRRHDLRRIVTLASPPEIIGIIDGVFFDNAAVAHREIIEALKSGIIVVGGGSMGALRASELETYGMIGVGKVFEMYRNGVIESDDEVAVTFDAGSNEALSVPLVNIRMTVEAAKNAGVIDPVQAAAIIGVARKLFYPDRNYQNVVFESEKNGIISGIEKKKLLDFIKLNEIDIKYQDAILVLEKIKELI
ncbi:MAG: TfuA-like protein [Candidatus Methanoperedens nitroreducens]|uniref:TfuA-like protein n=1 Tax=Candidatus Methanoperedens nitratireducens TaxID=1392998 RepID=A0A0P8C7I8_9EURY|nr:TfuA-related McrA-glycine thioamidation protein [Candidatus Methanoperedens sp. BLZ2]KAB2948084.1 MAG: TfuA-related McrA-glycine thioamidation protein [Candidatus Methanoperedens sp.]KPQ42737.1 MAG: TfuA-like protein [Candidatus Methanoperedens sp. BLZ1]MBZ0176399.1 TfuA-related McrA-glycine thioamidation protein [Candidatus Methanoperedens nitroreducens]MCX9077941.1 TfuA-related McrA-glycine thioamidation protein [Candidatus Methanoperedens sp.]